MDDDPAQVLAPFGPVEPLASPLAPKRWPASVRSRVAAGIPRRRELAAMLDDLGIEGSWAVDDLENRGGAMSIERDPLEIRLRRLEHELVGLRMIPSLRRALWSLKSRPVNDWMPTQTDGSRLNMAAMVRRADEALGGLEPEWQAVAEHLEKTRRVLRRAIESRRAGRPRGSAVADEIAGKVVEWAARWGVARDLEKSSPFGIALRGALSIAGIIPYVGDPEQWVRRRARSAGVLPRGRNSPDS